MSDVVESTVLTVGEVHTGILRNSTSVSRALSTQALSLLLGERVRLFQRPIAYAVSPDILTGLDCRLPTSSGARVRGIGTAISHATITGGHVLQGSTYARVVKSEADRRLPWSHYLSRPGVVETVGKVGRDDLADGFTAAKPSAVDLDLGAVSGRCMDAVQVSPGLDRTLPFRPQRTQLRWVAAAGGHGTADGPVRFTIQTGTLRTLRLGLGEHDVPTVVALCEDLALHDWLLTTLLELIERSRLGAGPQVQVVTRLRPAIDYLLHLWMPAARVDRSVLPIWESLERRPGFTRQWEVSVNRIRDQIAVSAVALLSAAAAEEKVR